jgi:purine-cytosine permease-like protein
MNSPDHSANTSSAIPQAHVSGPHRHYNKWIADETMEDYAIRYTPIKFRKWSEWRIANTAIGSLSFLAQEAIGALIAMNYGFANAMWAIMIVGLIVFLTGVPIAYYAVRYGIDIDLLTRGAGFGYLGSTVTSIIYISFTFIFFAIEAAIMAMALQMIVDWPLPVCYVLSSFIILPLVVRGTTFISHLQTWTQPLWLFLLILPFIWFGFTEPQLFQEFKELTGKHSFHVITFGAAATIVFALIMQIGEQVDFLRFLPQPQPGKRWRWWASLLVAGPGWIVLGMLQMAGGAFLAHAAMHFATPLQQAVTPPHMFLAAFREIFGTPGLAVAVTVVFVMISQIKVNVTNAYAGSLAWSNFFVRITHSHPGRVVWLVFNIFIATLLMALGVLDAIETVLSFYGIIAAAWIGALVADLVINKPLGLSPAGIEFRRAYLYDFNVGLGAMLLAILFGTMAYTGRLGPEAEAFAPFITLGLALLFSPMLSWLTKGRYYLARSPATGWKPGEIVGCSICKNSFEAEDMVQCTAHNASICSLCCSLENNCHDCCKGNHGTRAHWKSWLHALLPGKWIVWAKSRPVLSLLLLLGLCTLVAVALSLVHIHGELDATFSMLFASFFKIFSVLAMSAAICYGCTMRVGHQQHHAVQVKPNILTIAMQPRPKKLKPQAHPPANPESKSKP